MNDMKTISNEKEYNAIVKRINELLEIVTDENYDSVPQAIELDFISDLVEEYESKYYPAMSPSPSHQPIELIQYA
jgi:HTH-type transcriptional regulator/antitoxin HigA